jgi:hypothetical protein
VFNPVIPVNFMEKVYGLDLHKGRVLARISDAKGEKNLEQHFGTLTGDLTKPRDITVECSCGQTAMKSTSIYWIPICQTLQSDFSLKLANPLSNFTLIVFAISNTLSALKPVFLLSKYAQVPINFISHKTNTNMCFYSSLCKKITFFACQKTKNKF